MAAARGSPPTQSRNTNGMGETSRTHQAGRLGLEASAAGSGPVSDETALNITYAAGCGCEGAGVGEGGGATRNRPNFGPNQRSMSSMTEKAAGTITSVSPVEVMSPPMTAIAMGPRKASSPPNPDATGSMPATIA